MVIDVLFALCFVVLDLLMRFEEYLFKESICWFVWGCVLDLGDFVGRTVFVFCCLFVEVFV